MKATPTLTLREAGQSLWLDNITRELLTQRHAQALHRRARRSPGSPRTRRSSTRPSARARTTTPASAQKIAGGQVGRGALLRARARGPHPGRRPVPPDPRRARTASTAGSRSRSRRCSPTTRRARSPRPRSCTRAPGGRTSSSRSRARREGLPAIEEAIFAGVPVNVTLLFSREQYLAAAEAYMRGIERRIAAGLNPDVALGRLGLHQPLGRGGDGQGARGAARPARHRHRQAHLQGLPRPARLATAGSASPNAGARPQRLLWASTGTKDPKASDVLYVKRAGRAGHGQHDARGDAAAPSPTTARSAPLLPPDGGDAEEVLAQFAAAGVDVDALAADLQTEGAEAFVTSWNELMACHRRQERRARRRPS